MCRVRVAQTPSPDKPASSRPTIQSNPSTYWGGPCLMPVCAQKLYRTGTIHSTDNDLEIHRVPAENTGTIPSIGTIQLALNRDPHHIVFPTSHVSRPPSSATATDANVLPFRVIVLGLVLRGHEFDIDNDSFDPQQSAEERELARWDEVTFILAGLIMDGLISGVVRSRDAQLLLSKKTGFPDLPEVTETGLRPRLRPRPRPPSRHLRPTSTFNIPPVKVEL
ncbi:unnamed protein product [Ectocarpus sp. 12 AP-2014]